MPVVGRLAEVEPLHHVTVVALQVRQLIFRFDAFGDDFQPQPMRKANDSARDGSFAPGYVDGIDEGSIDLQHVDTKAFEIVLMGQVEVASHVGGAPVPLARLHSGDVFGEMSLLGGGLTSARVTAITPTTVLFLPRDDFNALVEGVPALLAHFATLANQRAAAQSVVLGRSGDLQGPDVLL